MCKDVMYNLVQHGHYGVTLVIVQVLVVVETRQDKESASMEILEKLAAMREAVTIQDHAILMSVHFGHPGVNTVIAVHHVDKVHNIEKENVSMVMLEISVV